MRRRIAAQLIARLNRDAESLARVFGLRYRSIEAERANVRARYGICYDDGSIRIRLFHAATGRPLKYSSLVSTLCHELAHLKHMNHGKRFQALYARILEHARREGIYRPGAPAEAYAFQEGGRAVASTRPERPRTPVQLALFG